MLARNLTWAFLFLLTGCGLQTIGIKHIDTLLMMQASRKMDLHSKQKDVLAADIAAFLNAQKGHVPAWRQERRHIIHRHLFCQPAEG